MSGLDAEGHAVGRAEREERPLVIAAGAVPGDLVEAEVEHATEGALFGRVLQVLEPGPTRVRPRCPIVGTCGGCPWQAMDYADQLARKRETLLAAVREIPALRDVPVSPVLAPAEPYGYRTKVQMPIGGRPGRLEIGFFRPHSKEIVEAPSCAVQHPAANRIVGAAKEILERSRLAPYDEHRHAGILRYLLLRVDPSGTRASLTLVVRDGRFPGREPLAERLARIEGVSGVAINVQPGRGNVVLGRRTESLAGRERVLVDVRGTRFLLSPTAFFQTSAFGVEALVERVRAHLPGPYETLVDLFCGVGLFARTLASHAKRVIGVEENPAAIEDAIAGARLARVEHVEFLAAPCERWAQGASPADAVVLDPPRRGCEEALLEALVTRLRPRAMAYVSCAPASLLRDLTYLADRGYRVRAIDPVDMFPHTPHLECVAAIERITGRR